jgi:putative chitinase
MTMKPAPLTAFGLKQIDLIAGRAIDTANAKSALLGLEMYGYEKLGLNRPHRLAQYLAQIMHESARFRYDRELWGPTPAQKRYDTRTDLGNTAAVDGDGKLYAGRAGIQITGKTNYAAFTKWTKKIDPRAPDFVKNPNAVNTDPWEGLAAIWYWETHNLNYDADRGDTDRITKRINGGYNGRADRRDLFVRTALVLLGYEPTEVIRFQMNSGLSVDGVAGPVTHNALHYALLVVPALGAPKAPAVVKPALTSKTPYGIIGAIIMAAVAAYNYFAGG